MNAILTPEQLEALRRLDACTLANAIETFHERLRNEGFIDHSIRSIFPRLQPMVGFAATLKIRGSEPSTPGGIYPDRTDCRNRAPGSRTGLCLGRRRLGMERRMGLGGWTLVSPAVSACIVVSWRLVTRMGRLSSSTGTLALDR